MTGSSVFSTRFRTMKSPRFAISILCTLFLWDAAAQVFSPQSTGKAAGPSSSSGSSPGNSSGSGSSSSPSSSSSSQGKNKGQDPIMGNLLPMFDPSTETVLFEGQMWDINDNRLLNARFEKYLNSPPADSAEDREYRAIMENIRKLLSPHNKSRGGFTDLQGAVALLEKAAEYRQDARISESLANAIYRIWLARKEVQNLERANERLRDLRKSTARNYEIKSEPTISESNKSSQSQGSSSSSSKGNQRSTAATISQAGEYVTRYTEIQAKITANEGKMAISDVESKLSFQALLVQLFAQRRFEHVVAGARLYTEFYKDGAAKIDFKEGSDAEKMFKDVAGFDPTVNTLDTLANEAIRDTEQAVEAFEFLITKDERASASKRLMEAFLVGEFLPPLQSVSLEKKQSILEFVRAYNQLLSSLEVKDYTLAEQKTSELRTLGSDFDASKPLAAINTAKLTSSMHLQTAQNEALRGNEQAYQQHIASAAQIWPTNPDLQRTFNLMASQGNVQIQTVNDLDRLIATKSFRQIFTDRGRYIASVVNDPERQKALEEIIGNITKIDIAIQQAQKLDQVGNPYGAWETVEEVFADFPDDPPLTKARSDYATRVASFVGSLKNAEDLEKRNQHGSSLAWYLKCRQIYPSSTFAARGIRRLVDTIIPESGAETGSALITPVK